MRDRIYYSSKKSTLYIFSVFFLITLLTKYFLAPTVIPRSIPVAYMSLVFACLSLGFVVHTAVSSHMYMFTLFILLGGFFLYSIAEARFFLPLYYSSNSLLTMFYLIYFIQILACLAIGGYQFKPYISWIFLLAAICFLIVLQPKIKIITFLLYIFIIFVNLYTYILFLLLRFVMNQNKRLVEAREKIVEQEKMASLATLSAGLAHEINNPLNHMYGNLHFLETYHQQFIEKCRNITDVDLHYSLDDMGKILQRYREGFDRIVQIITTMKHAFPIKSTSQKEENITQILESAVSYVGKSISPQIRFTNNSESNLIYRCNAADILTLAISLLQNSVDAVSYKDGDKEVVLDAFKKNNYIEIRVTDNGTGIDEKTMHNIFEPFFTTKRQKENIGIGLTLCKNIINKYNGEIQIDSKPESFTVFTIKLPLKPRI